MLESLAACHGLLQERGLRTSIRRPIRVPTLWPTGPLPNTASLSCEDAVNAAAAAAAAFSVSMLSSVRSPLDEEGRETSAQPEDSVPHVHLAAVSVVLSNSGHKSQGPHRSGDPAQSLHPAGVSPGPRTALGMHLWRRLTAHQEFLLQLSF